MSRAKTSRWAVTVDPEKAANDNTPTTDSQKPVSARSGVETICDMPDSIGLLEGEVDLLSRYWDDLIKAANDDAPLAEDG